MEAYKQALERVGQELPGWARQWLIQQALPRRLSTLVDGEGDLTAYAWPGGYPVLYLTSAGDTLCAECVVSRALGDDEWNKDSLYRLGHFIHYEGAPEQCSDCGEETESAYGDPEEVEEEDEEEDEEDEEEDEEDEEDDEEA